jgi:small-conductance mechanosensitive channel
MFGLSRILGAGFVWLLILSQTAIGQQIPPAPDKRNPTPSEVGGQTLWDFFSAKTPYEFWLTCAILLSGLAFAALAIRFLGQIHRQQLDSATRAMTILFVIIATMVLITAGYNNEQIAPAFGLFGTIVGYILGRGAQQPLPTANDEDEGAVSRNTSKASAPRSKTPATKRGEK